MRECGCVGAWVRGRVAGVSATITSSKELKTGGHKPKLNKRKQNHTDRLKLGNGRNKGVPDLKVSGLAQVNAWNQHTDGHGEMFQRRAWPFLEPDRMKGVRILSHIRNLPRSQHKFVDIDNHGISANVFPCARIRKAKVHRPKFPVDPQAPHSAGLQRCSAEKKQKIKGSQS